MTNSQLFPFPGGAGPLVFSPSSSVGTCLTPKSNVLDETTCDSSDETQWFNFGAGAQASSLASSPTAASTSPVAIMSAPSETTTPSSRASSTVPSSNIVVESAVETAASTANSASVTVAPSVSRAGGVLNPTAAAKANTRDDTATRAFSSVSLKSASGQCLFIDPTAGDFRENLIPVKVVECTGSANEKFDIITAGVHNNVANSTLVVSSLVRLLETNFQIF